MTTTFGWDASNYDDVPTVRDGIDFYTHKAAEGHHTYYDREYKASLNAANALGIPVLGAYFVNHPGSVADQVDWFVAILDQDTPWWRTHSCFILQIDAEKFDYMPSAPTKVEIQAFGDRLVNTHGVLPNRILAYAPQWLYGNTLTGLTYRLWASAYGPNPYAHYTQAYPGDSDGKRWQAYSGQTPLILQYGSNTTIGNQTTCDANAYRGTLQQLMSDLGADVLAPKSQEEDDDMIAMLVEDSTGMAVMWYDGPNCWYRGIPDNSDTTRANLAKAGVTTYGDNNWAWNVSPHKISDFASPWQNTMGGGIGGNVTFSRIPTFDVSISGTATPKE